MEKTSRAEVCPRCATLATAVYDRRWAVVRDAPIRDRHVVLRIRKRRFFCRPCQRPFTEPVPGIRKGRRTTERFRKDLLWACERFGSLKDVLAAYRCSSGYLYKALYAELERKRRTRLYPWPRVVGLDEHFFRRRLGFRDFVTMVVDHKGRRLFEVARGRTQAELFAQLAHIPGRDNVRFVVTDLCDPYKSFARSFFPNAWVVADKFHVLRLLHPALLRHARLVAGDRASLRFRRLLLKSAHRLDPLARRRLRMWVTQHPALAELYAAKEALHGLYRVRGYRRAKTALTALTDRLATSLLPELQRLRRTLLKWRREILAHFGTGLTNGRTEGFNNVAKVVKKRAYGYRNFENYRLRLLNTCAGRHFRALPTIK